MDNETRQRAAKSMCLSRCIGAPGNKDKCYFPRVYIVKNRFTYFKHIALDWCKELGIADTVIEILTMQDAWLLMQRVFMPLSEQALINEGIEDQVVDTNITDAQRRLWAEERENKSLKS